MRRSHHSHERDRAYYRSVVNLAIAQVALKIRERRQPDTRTMLTMEIFDLAVKVMMADSFRWRKF